MWTQLSSLLASFGSSVSFVAIGAFFARICDESIGGTYLTMLNTVANFGGLWPKAIVLWLVDALSTTHSDGYYVVVGASLVYNVAFLYIAIDQLLMPLQQAAPRDWCARRDVAPRCVRDGARAVDSFSRAGRFNEMTVPERMCDSSQIVKTSRNHAQAQR